MLPTPGSSHCSSCAFAPSHLFCCRKCFSVSQELGGMEQGQKGGSRVRKKNQQKQNSDRVVSCKPDIRDRKTFLMATHMGKVTLLTLSTGSLL